MITIVDYQMGNLRSVSKAIQRVGEETLITSDPGEIASAEKLILPGVGGFKDAIAELNRRDLANPIRDFIDSGRPFLGICLGLQMLFDSSEEGGQHEGLGIIPGEVVRFPADPALKVPHMGWNQVQITQPTPLMQGIEPGTHFYFVHSYYVKPTDRSVVAIEADYGAPFCAAIWRNNLHATQFHPEKSQGNGMKLLKNFVSLDAPGE
ncbi:imidazole glycerol phosphate synthase subunit HisH [Rosistilla oblonga]|uniref:Imidazole glycerol phosphate synthase subunit HisH n=1 Tax=Rosistilla oblonga TaxID=2527990 RepID=A0A518IXJ3_9BACT|nr:imidazole glycerol phosphate synthase subunit HisH [Rosistilla oblonga]QDV57812.1 Imidazole glycerol phosphate synthase subunit HisH 1 [Rosistilla oblonga]